MESQPALILPIIHLWTHLQKLLSVFQKNPVPWFVPSINVEFIIGISVEFISDPLIRVSLTGLLLIKLTFAIIIFLAVFTCEPTNLKVLFPLDETVIVFV